MTDIKLWFGDCLDLMGNIQDKSIDMILADLPYGTTSCKWDIVIPFEKLWNQYERLIKNDGNIVLFGSEPFSSLLRVSNLKMYKYDWIWNKVKPSGHLNSKIMPMKYHETISVFNFGKAKYFPIMEKQVPRISKNYLKNKSELFGKEKEIETIRCEKYPSSIITISNANQKGKLHPTQKPTELLKYLILTYSLKEDNTLDNTMGVGSTMVACKDVERRGIGIEKEKKYYDIAVQRLRQ